VKEKGITFVNPYRFFHDCINQYIIAKADENRDYSISINSDDNLIKEGYIAGDWVKISSIYGMNIKSSTAWKNDNVNLESGSFLKSIALLPLL
jgi:hypothetical protein